MGAQPSSPHPTSPTPPAAICPHPTFLDVTMGGGGDTHPAVPPRPHSGGCEPLCTPQHLRVGGIPPPTPPLPPTRPPPAVLTKGQPPPAVPADTTPLMNAALMKGGAQLKCHRGGLGLRPDVMQRSARGSPPAPSLPSVPVRALPPPRMRLGGADGPAAFPPLKIPHVPAPGWGHSAPLCPSGPERWHR